MPVDRRRDIWTGWGHETGGAERTDKRAAVVGAIAGALGADHTLAMLEKILQF